MAWNSNERNNNNENFWLDFTSNIPTSSSNNLLPGSLPPLYPRINPTPTSNYLYNPLLTSPANNPNLHNIKPKQTLTPKESYNFKSSFNSIKRIINSRYEYETLDSIPPEIELTYKNGFYVDCAALFVDLRDSSKLPEYYNRPVLAKVYRAFISEIVAILRKNYYCKHIKIVGDCVQGVFNLKNQIQARSILNSAKKINSLIRFMNCEFEKNNLPIITMGTGISYGRALMIKAGKNQSGVNEVIWMGDVLNRASKLCNNANKLISNSSILISQSYYDFLSENEQSLFLKSYELDCFYAHLEDRNMTNWIIEQYY